MAIESVPQAANTAETPLVERQSPAARAFADAPTSPAMPQRQPTLALSLRTNFLWTFVGNVVYAGCQWGMLVVLAKLGNPEMVGRFALGLAVTAPVLMFLNLQLRGVQATDARHEYTFGDYLGLRLLTAAIALVVIGGLVLVSGYPRTTAFVVLLIGLAKVLESISDVFYGLLQQHERMDRIAIAMMLKGVLSLAVLVVLVWRTGSLVAGAIGLAASWGVLLVANDFRNGRLVLRAMVLTHPGERQTPSLAPRWVPATLLRLIWLALPLGVVMLLISLNANIPRYFIERQLDTHALGLFSALAYLLVAGNTVVGALGQSASPRLAQYYATGEQAAFRALVLKLTGIGALLGLLGLAMTALAGRPLLRLLYRPEYAEQLDVFLWLMIGGGLAYVASFLGYAMTAARVFRAQAPLFLATGAVTLTACAFLIPQYQLAGAAIAMAIAAAFQLLGSTVIVARSIRHLDTREKARS